METQNFKKSDKVGKNNFVNFDNSGSFLFLKPCYQHIIPLTTTTPGIPYMFFTSYSSIHLSTHILTNDPKYYIWNIHTVQNAVWWSRRDGWGGESPDLGFQGYAGKNSLLLVIFLAGSSNCREFMLDFCVIEENKFNYQF